jgi:hypothetical protein
MLTSLDLADFRCQLSQSDWDWFLHHADDWTITMNFQVGVYSTSDRVSAHWTPPYP